MIASRRASIIGDDSAITPPRSARARALGRTACLVLTATCTCACIDRSRTNSDCRWDGDRSYPLDLAKAADRRHLVGDAQLAEELAVRRADTEHRRRYGYGGHGGLIDHGRIVRECMATLVDTIVRTHGVTPPQVDEARAVRDARFDALVATPFAMLYVAAAAASAEWIRRRFLGAPRLAVGSFAAAASVAFSALGLQLFVVWTAVWETVRIGNDHFGTFRAARPIWSAHIAALFAGGIVVFCAAAVVRVIQASRAGAARDRSCADGGTLPV